jgi:hypothetical protein
LLGYVLVHEITHNLQGIARHSKTGIMKPRWTPRDYVDMGVRQLHFERIDIELIYAGLGHKVNAGARLMGNR